MERKNKVGCSICGKKIDEIDAKILFNEVSQDIYCEDCFEEMTN